MNVRRATEADVEAARRLCEASNEEVTFTPYQGSWFDPILVTDHIALVAEDDAGEIAGAVLVGLSCGASPRSCAIAGSATSS